MKIYQVFILSAGILSTSCANSSYEVLNKEDTNIAELCQESYDIALDNGFHNDELTNDRKDSDGNTAINYRLCRRTVFSQEEICINAVTEKHCGDCELACPERAKCKNTGIKDGERIYECRCPSGEKICNNKCVNITDDNKNCGGCGIECPKNQFGEPYKCVNSRCDCASADLELIGNECVDIRKDNRYCGQAKKPCLFDTQCNNGVCSQCPDGFVFVKGGSEIIIGSAGHTSEFHDGAYSYDPLADSQNTPAYYAEIAKGLDDGKAVSDKLYQVIERAHKVTITHDFCMMQHEVMENIDMWLANKYDAGNEKPLTRTTWYDAVALANDYTSYLNKRGDDTHQLAYCYVPHDNDGKCQGKCEMDGSYIDKHYISCTGVRLPSEYEWEYAARGGEYAKTYKTLPTAGKVLSSESELQSALKDYAWYSDNSQFVFHTRSEVKSHNPLHLYNMQGNAAEWTNDAFDEEKARQNAKDIQSSVTLRSEKDPIFYQKGEEGKTVLHVVKGCHINSPAVKCRDAQRSFESKKSPVIGQRFVVPPIYDKNGRLIVPESSEQPPAEEESPEEK